MFSNARPWFGAAFLFVRVFRFHFFPGPQSLFFFFSLFHFLLSGREKNAGVAILATIDLLLNGIYATFYQQEESEQMFHQLLIPLQQEVSALRE